MAEKQEEKKKYRLGEILINLGVLTHTQLDRALAIQDKQSQEERFPIGRILLEEGYIEPNDLIEAIKIQSQQL